MENLFILLILALALFAILTMTIIVREVLPNLGGKEQVYFRDWLRTWGTIRFDRALRRAWDEHARMFPRSRKRMLFGVLFLAIVLLVMGYPLWLSYLHS